GTLHTRVAARGYLPASTIVSFARFPSTAVSVYRPSLQWTMYGANLERTQAQSQIHLRPPFRVLWSRSLHGLIEFPAVVSEGKAYIGNARGTVFAIDMSDGDVLWRRSIRNGKMAASPAVWGKLIVVHGMDGRVRVLR